MCASHRLDHCRSGSATQSSSLDSAPILTNVGSPWRAVRCLPLAMLLSHPHRPANPTRVYSCGIFTSMPTVERGEPGNGLCYCLFGCCMPCSQSKNGSPQTFVRLTSSSKKEARRSKRRCSLRLALMKSGLRNWDWNLERKSY